MPGTRQVPKNFDAVIIGHYEDDRLIYVARTRNGFTPASREALFRRFKGLETAQCPFANLPEAKSGRDSPRQERGGNGPRGNEPAPGRAVARMS